MLVLARMQALLQGLMQPRLHAQAEQQGQAQASPPRRMRRPGQAQPSNMVSSKLQREGRRCRTACSRTMRTGIALR